MKTTSLIILCCFIFLNTNHICAQVTIDSVKKALNTQYVIQKFDGDVFVGKKIYEDPRVIQLRVKKLGVISIKKNDIEVLRAVNRKELASISNYVPNEVFSTKYFVTSNSLPVKKHENFAQWNWFGPDLHYSFAKNFDASVNTTWAAIPIIGRFQYDVVLGKKAGLGLGTLFGWGSWGFSDCNGVFPFASISIGDRKASFTCSGGYGLLTIYGVTQPRSMFSLAGIAKAGNRTSLVFDSFILPASGANTQDIDIFIPGIRFQTNNSSAFQLGLGVLSLGDDFVPAPIPFVSWFRMI